MYICPDIAPPKADWTSRYRHLIKSFFCLLKVLRKNNLKMFCCDVNVSFDN